MSNAKSFPKGADAISIDLGQALRSARFRSLVAGTIQRLRGRDGPTYARSVGFQLVMATLPGIIFFTGMAAWTGAEALITAVEGTFTALTPGPTAEIFRTAIDQADARSGNVPAVTAGGLAALTSGALGMAQIASAANRIYDVNGDRPVLRRYALATALAVGAGLLLLIAFVAISAGDIVGEIVGDGSLWLWLRWPLGIVTAVAAITLLYRLAPYRHQPPLRWLVIGAGLATVLWLVATGGLSAYLRMSSTFGEIYGPLAGFIGLMLWGQATGLALLAGISFVAELEAEARRPMPGPIVVGA